MAEPFLGEIRIFGFNFAPRGWAFCNGQLLSIAQNTALFSILGTTYGGNGQTNFALPNLQGTAAMNQGTGPGLTPRAPGELVGESAVTLLVTEIPAHTHTINGNQGTGDSNDPSGRLFGVEAPPRQSIYNDDTDNLIQFAPQAIGVTGGSQPHNNMQPYLALNVCIAMEGIFPSRN